MKDIRPSTWALLGVMALLIIGPLFLLDIDPIQQLEPGGDPQTNGPIRPHDPNARDNSPAVDQPGNQPASNQQPGPRENGLVE